MNFRENEHRFDKMYGKECLRHKGQHEKNNESYKSFQEVVDGLAWLGYRVL